MRVNALPEGEAQVAQCKTCGGWPKMEFRRGIRLGSRIMHGDVPVMVCQGCSTVTVPDAVRRAAGSPNGHGTVRFPHRRFGLCKDVGFRYSSVDWDVIPRLRQSDYDPDGYYVPVFFDQRALLKYVVRPEYAMVHFKDGGIIKFAGGQDLKYGITRSGLMVCWLGELDGIPEREQHYLLSDNQESDHDVSSWLYRDRLGIPAEPSEERRLAMALLDANRTAQDRLGRPLWLLEHREIQIMHVLARPVIWNEFASYAINNLNKVLIESIDRDYLREEVGRRKGSANPEEHKEEARGHVSSLEEFLNVRFGDGGRPGFEAFRTLRNWRNSLDHVTADARNCSTDWVRMRAMPPNPGHERVYNAMLPGLTTELGQISRLMSGEPAAVDERPSAPGRS